MLDGRLATRLAEEHGYQVPAERPAVAPGNPSSEPTSDETDAVAANAAAENPAPAEANGVMPPSGEEDGAPAFDEASEAAFLAEARDRGEAVSRTPGALGGEADENGGKPLPKLDELVNRIPSEVRDVLDELFRARFVTVRRFPKKVLKG